MIRVGAFAFALGFTGAAGADVMSSPPAQALWSFLGSGSVAGVLYLWVRSEQREKTEAVKERSDLLREMTKIIKDDVEFKAAVRERLGKQDQLLEELVRGIGTLRNEIVYTQGDTPRRGR